MYQIIDSDVIFKQRIVEQHHTRLKINLTAIERITMQYHGL